MIVVDVAQPRLYEWWSICSCSSNSSNSSSGTSNGGSSQFRSVVVGELEGKKTEDGMKNGSRKTRNGRREKEMAVQVGST